MGSATVPALRPGSGNTGAEITEAPEPGSLRALVDWLEGSFPAELSRDSVFDILGAPAEEGALRSDDGRCLNFEEFESARGVKYWKCGHVRISERSSGGWWFCASGQGCREMEGAGVVGDWSAFVGHLLLYSFKPARLDFAIDDAQGLVPMREVAGIVASIAKPDAPIRTRAHRTRIFQEFDRQGGEGTTYYIGSAQSDTLVRIYDAARSRGLEQIQWTRVELQLRSERAEEACKLIASAGDVAPLVGVLRSHVDFLDPDSLGDQVNMSRRPIASWWQALTQGVERLRLHVSRVQKTVEDVVSWLHRQCAPSLGLILNVPGLGLDMLLTLACAGEKRLSNRHRRMLQEVKNRFSGADRYVESSISRYRVEITQLVDSYRYDIPRAPI